MRTGSVTHFALQVAKDLISHGGLALYVALPLAVRARFPQNAADALAHPLTSHLHQSQFGALVTKDQLILAKGWPEHQVPIDTLRGEPPSIDLAIVSDGIQGRTSTCVEAKADEAFGKYTSAVFDDAMEKINKGVVTGALERLLHLEESLLPEPSPGLPGRAEIRYQLLTGTGAALALAKKEEAPVAVFVVHEFSFSGYVDEKKLKQNKIDLDRFVMRLTGGSATSLQEGVLLGQPTTPSFKNKWSGVSLYIGKVITSVEVVLN